MSSIDSAKKQRRPFFVGMGLFLLSIGAWKTLKAPGSPPLVLLGFGFFLTIVDFVLPPVSHALFRAWMAFAVVLGTINTWILISLVYFLLMTPISLLMRVFQKAGPHSAKTWKKRRSSWVSLDAELKDQNYYAPY